MKNLKLTNLKNIEKNEELIYPETIQTKNIKSNAEKQSKNIRDIDKREHLTKYNVKNTQELFREYMEKMNNRIRKI